MKLPVVTPPIEVSPQYADLLSVICTQKNGYNFYLERFVQIYNSRATYDFGELAFREHIFSLNKLEGMAWYNYLPMISDYNIINNINLICEKKDLIQKFKKMLDSGYYLLTYMNRKYYNNYNGNKIYHNCMIYGYDINVFYVQDFVNGRYSKFTINKDDLLQNYFENQNFNDDIDYPKKLIMFKNNDVPYEIDMNLLINSMRDYYNETSTIDSYEVRRDSNSKNKICNTEWGMGAVKLIANDLGEHRNTLKDISIINTHAKCMIDKAKYFINNKMVDNSIEIEYNEILNTIDIALMLYLKYIKTQNKIYINKCSDYIKKTYSLEKIAIEKILKEID